MDQPKVFELIKNESYRFNMQVSTQPNPIDNQQKYKLLWSFRQNNEVKILHSKYVKTHNFYRKFISIHACLTLFFVFYRKIIDKRTHCESQRSMYESYAKGTLSVEISLCKECRHHARKVHQTTRMVVGVDVTRQRLAIDADMIRRIEVFL